MKVTRPTVGKYNIVILLIIFMAVYYEMMWNANLMQQGNFVDIYLARHASGIYAHHQAH